VTNRLRPFWPRIWHPHRPSDQHLFPAGKRLARVVRRRRPSETLIRSTHRSSVFRLVGGGPGLRIESVPAVPQHGPSSLSPLWRKVYPKSSVGCGRCRCWIGRSAPVQRPAGGMGDGGREIVTRRRLPHSPQGEPVNRRGLTCSRSQAAAIAIAEAETGGRPMDGASGNDAAQIRHPLPR